jgi:hypothetical protein
MGGDDGSSLTFPRNGSFQDPFRGLPALSRNQKILPPGVPSHAWRAREGIERNLIAGEPSGLPAVWKGLEERLSPQKMHPQR